MNQCRNILATALCLLLVSCGTDVSQMLRKDSKVSWNAFESIAHADEPERAALGQLARAEKAKHEACSDIYAAAHMRLASDQPPPWFDRFLSDLQRFAALLIPIPRVERCAKSIDAFEQSFLHLYEGR